MYTYKAAHAKKRVSWFSSVQMMQQLMQIKRDIKKNYSTIMKNSWLYINQRNHVFLKLKSTFVQILLLKNTEVLFNQKIK